MEAGQATADQPEMGYFVEFVTQSSMTFGWRRETEGCGFGLDIGGRKDGFRTRSWALRVKEYLQVDLGFWEPKLAPLAHNRLDLPHCCRTCL